MTTQNLPKTFPINHDDYHAEYIGRLDNGRQFFLTNPFVPQMANESGCEFVALFYFDNKGIFLEAKIENLGPRNLLDQKVSERLFQAYLDEIADGEFTDIEIAPFEIERFGTKFGFIPRPLEDEEDEWGIEFHPGNYMAFFAPWDGDYDT